MKCPHCLSENEKNAPFCRNCSAWILGDVYLEDPALAPVVQTEPEAAPAKKKKKWLIPVIALATALAIGITVILWPDSASPEPYEPVVNVDPTVQIPKKEYMQHLGGVMHLTGTDGDAFLLGEQLIDIPLAVPAMTEYFTSLDGMTAAFLHEGNLYYLRDDEYHLVAGNVIQLALSVNGKYIAYRDNESNLWLYHIGDEQSTLIAQHTETFAISPNGKTLAYLQKMPIATGLFMQFYELHYYIDGETFTFETETPLTALDILSVSNGGECTYLLYMDALTGIDKDGNLTHLGTIVPNYDAPLLSDLYQKLNADHTQLIYYTEDGTYLSHNGQAGTLLSEYQLEPILPSLTTAVAANAFAATYPHRDFGDQLLFAYDFIQDAEFNSGSPLVTCRIWHLSSKYKANERFVELANIRLDTTGRYLYCLDSDGRLFQYTPATRTQTTIAGDVYTFAVTPDGSTVFFVTNDGVLHRCSNEDLKTTEEILHVGKVHMNTTATGDLWCLDLYGMTLYALPAGGSSFRILQQVQTYRFGTNQQLYAQTRDGLFQLKGGQWNKLENYGFAGFSIYF